MSLLRRVAPAPVRRLVGARRASRLEARLDVELRTLAERTGPIIAGPWLGEVGFELLYWVPFLAWVADRFGIAPERMIAVSRGGTCAWYTDVAGCYYDAFDTVTPEEFRRQHDSRVRALGEQKQRRITPFDDVLIGRVRERVAGSAAVLHPATMYELMSPYWYGHVGVEWVLRHARYRRLSAASGAAAAAVRHAATHRTCEPGSYVAVKFYFNASFPDTDQTRAFARRVVRDLAAQGPVVVLPTAGAVDDHEDADLRDEGVITPPAAAAATNLAAQSAIVAGARAFVGTYGGFSYLAPFHGVPATAYYLHEDRFSARHLAMARAALGSLGSGDLLQVRPAAT